jgi:acid phosphatase type 7
MWIYKACQHLFKLILVTKADLARLENLFGTAKCFFDFVTTSDHAGDFDYFWRHSKDFARLKVLGRAAGSVYSFWAKARNNGPAEEPIVTQKPDNPDATLESVIGKTAYDFISGRNYSNIPIKYARKLAYGLSVAACILELSGCGKKATEIIATSPSDNTSVQPTEPYIKVLRPNGNEDWFIGSMQNIVWEHNLPRNLQVQLSLEDINGSVTKVADTENDGNETIQVPDVMDGPYKIMVSSSERKLSDSSDEFFRIAFLGERPQTVELIALGDAVDLARLDIAEKMRRLLDRFPSAQIAWLGDIQYPDGSLDQFLRGFDPIHGSLRNRSIVVPGNHEYQTPAAAGYFRYFERLPSLNDLFRRNGISFLGQFYSLKYGNWKIYALNSSDRGIVPIGRGSPQIFWLEEDINRDPSLCSLSMIHHPFNTVGRYPGEADNQRDIQRLMYEKGVEIDLSGHDHNLQAFKKLDPDGRVDPRGRRYFVSGGGGHSLLYGVRGGGNSEFSVMSHGILHLTLRQKDYSFRFLDIDGNQLFSGSDVCH